MRPTERIGPRHFGRKLKTGVSLTCHVNAPRVNSQANSPRLLSVTLTIAPARLDFPTLPPIYRFVRIWSREIHSFVTKVNPRERFLLPFGYNLSMHPVTNKKLWRAQFQATAEELARLATLELAKLTDEEALQRLQRLEPVERPWREDPNWSGLVEWQAILHRRKVHARI
jgi:hypothetical protein